MEKEFLTYNQQMRYLRDSKNIECAGTMDKKILCKEGDKHIYIGGTDLNQLYQLKNFDNELRYHLLKYITKVEEELRNLVGYKFDSINNEGKIPWYNVEAYNPDIDTKDIVNVISHSYQQIQKSQQNYIRHYFDNHKYIPTWILTKTINFSTFIDFLECSKREVKDSICELYGIKRANGNNDIKLLIGSLHWMRKVRNSCAHNERIYGMRRDTGRIHASYFNNLPQSYLRERKQMVMDIIIYMRYYLSNADFKKFVGEIKRLVKDLQKNINNTSFNKVRADMGIKDLSHLDLLIQINKKIEYNKF